MDPEKRLITSVFSTEEDGDAEVSLRPKTFESYYGQEKVKDQVKVFIQAAKQRGEALDHVLLYGPPGLGKTTLSQIIASEMNAAIKITSGPAIERPGDMASMLNDLNDGDVLFIDEIHRLPRVVEEVLYPAMEDFVFDIVIGKGQGAKSIRINLPKFTLIGATTRAGLLTSPLRDRFGVIQRLEMYSIQELSAIILRSAGVLGVETDQGGAEEIARRSRGTPRVANRLLRRVRDFAQVRYGGVIDKATATASLDILEVDKAGLDNLDRNVLFSIMDKFAGGPVGLDTLAISTNEDAETIEDVCEPYLIQLGYVQRTPRGRVVTELAYEHFGRAIT
jgi:Holliday junction DNA helicase RuvB